MIVWIVGQTDDVVVVGVRFQCVVEIGYVLALAQFRLDYNLCLWTNFAAGLDASIEVFGKIGKGSCAVIPTIGIAMASRP